MDEIVRRAVARAIMTMRDNLGEHLTIDDLARAAMFSKFHFSRVFHRATGLSPGRFLSALRLAEAKRLLISTPISVADISHQVGYNSVGTFSARFSGSVGLSPTAYRRTHGRRPPGFEQAPEPRSGVPIRGQLGTPPGTDFGEVFVGLFTSRITEGPPVRHTILSRPGPFLIPAAPAGTWYVIAHAFGRSVAEDGERAYTGVSSPVTIRPSVTASLADVQLRPRTGFDPPLLLAMPDLRRASVRHAVAV